MADETTTTNDGTTGDAAAVAGAPETLLGANTSATTGTTSAPESAAATPGQAPLREAPSPEAPSRETTAGEEKAARLKAFAGAEGREAKLAAWNALSRDEQKGAWKDVPAEVRKELGLANPEGAGPARPTYTDFKLPDGFTADETALKAASDLFADSGLSQEQAQKFIDLAASREKAAAQAGVQAFADLQTRWVSEIKADPEIGGDRLQASIASAARAIDRLAVPGLREALDLTGAGNNPAIVKAFARLGQLIAEDRFRPGNGAPPNPQRSPAEVIYGARPRGGVDEEQE